MSDDEEYYDEYDEDIFWIEEPEPEIADDLAATAVYDALFFEDPSLEVEDYYSDWDDQSDDYYDEDPTAIRRQRAMGLWPNNYNIKEINDILAAKKNLSAHNGTIPKKTLPETNVASFQGTVWKTLHDDSPPRKLYEPGDGEKVALLKNWREVFRSSHPAIGRVRMRKVGSDMAPPRAPEVSKRADTSSDDTSTASSLESLRETDVGSDGCSKTTTPAEPSLSPPLTVHSHRVIKSASDLPVNSKMLEHEFPIEAPESYDDPMAMEPESPDLQSATTQDQESSPKKPNSATAPSTRTRKRKASDALDQPDVDKNQTTTRSKRIASKKVGETADPPAASGPVRRSTRNKAKQ
ncbi:hypothetical protein ANOM_001262 [Aspergillus nomiae NRRL 13137]|uniref:Uncharacterized protein n=1 Tax=Aspergillus nomiae NRRL (strain ATCC 15546 / NRRL 13137 / CBS 260.88 / M93) TaxID=1509407 RepID=A0A0L1JFJ8_ASPN3|nr:uncharacterized protein ANOM_001262 [Aspergillus nomiae NRRL 13137]KNG90506.1 hypothetical protein ANOM_001262 [Aspergillus nomiae NRRL 13137]